MHRLNRVEVKTLLFPGSYGNAARGYNCSTVAQVNIDFGLHRTP